MGHRRGISQKKNVLSLPLLIRAEERTHPAIPIFLFFSSPRYN